MLYLGVGESSFGNQYIGRNGFEWLAGWVGLHLIISRVQVTNASILHQYLGRPQDMSSRIKRQINITQTKSLMKTNFSKFRQMHPGKTQFHKVPSRSREKSLLMAWGRMIPMTMRNNRVLNGILGVHMKIIISAIISTPIPN